MPLIPLENLEDEIKKQVAEEAAWREHEIGEINAIGDNIRNGQGGYRYNLGKLFERAHGPFISAVLNVLDTLQAEEKFEFRNQPVSAVYMGISFTRAHIVAMHELTGRIPNTLQPLHRAWMFGVSGEHPEIVKRRIEGTVFDLGNEARRQWDALLQQEPA